MIGTRCALDIAASPTRQPRGHRYLRLNGGAERQQFLEIRGIIASALGIGDEDVPTVFRERSPLRDCNSGAQAERRCDIFAP
jgi:hypothetical protein